MGTSGFFLPLAACAEKEVGMKHIACAVALLATMPALFAGGKAETRERSPRPAPAKETEIVVAAAASLTDVLTELILLYRESKPGVRVTATFGSSGSLARQIDQGAPIDVFFPASARHMDLLAASGRIDAATRRDIAGNELVLVVPSGRDGIVSFADLGTGKARLIAMGEPGSVPAGIYAGQVFDYLGITGATRGKCVFAKDVRQVLAYVEAGEVDAGIVYATDAAQSTKARVVAKAPTGSHEPIVYPAAVVSGSERSDAARDFVNWLAGPDAREVLARSGFAIR